MFIDWKLSIIIPFKEFVSNIILFMSQEEKSISFNFVFINSVSLSFTSFKIRFFIFDSLNVDKLKSLLFIIKLLIILLEKLVYFELQLLNSTSFILLSMNVVPTNLQLSNTTLLINCLLKFLLDKSHDLKMTSTKSIFSILYY